MPRSYRIFGRRSTEISVARDQFPGRAPCCPSPDATREFCWYRFITFLLSELFLVVIHRLDNSERLPNSRYPAYHGKGRRLCPVFVYRASSASISLAGSPMTCTLGRYQDAIPSGLRPFVSHSKTGRKIPFKSDMSSPLRKAQGVRCLTKKQRLRALQNRARQARSTCAELLAFSDACPNPRKSLGYCVLILTKCASHRRTGPTNRSRGRPINEDRAKSSTLSMVGGVP